MFKYITWDNFCMKLVSQNILTATKCKFEYTLRNVFTKESSLLCKFTNWVRHNSQVAAAKYSVNKPLLYSAMHASNIIQVNTGDIKSCQKCVIHRTHWEHWSNGCGIQRAVCTFGNRACGCAQYGVRDTYSLWDGVEASCCLATSTGQYILLSPHNNSRGATP